MRILIDGDAFPNVKEIIEIARKYQKEVYIFMDFSHHLETNYGKIFYVSKGNNAADTALENHIEKGDLVLTQDYGVAIIGLGRGAICIHQNGFLYQDYNIDYLMEMKSLNLKKRKHVHLKGPKRRTKIQEERLFHLIEDLIKNRSEVE